MTVITIEQNKKKQLYDFAVSCGCNSEYDASLKKIVTFRTGGCCPVLISPKSVDALSAVIAYMDGESIPFTVLGNGSNVLVPDEGIDRPVIHISDGMDKISIDGEKLYCEAGTKLISLCLFALENSLSGLEFAYGIPGSCGGAVIMNAGAYGGEMKDVITRVDYLTRDGRAFSLSGSESDFSYRNSIYKKNGYIVTGVEVTLTRGNKDEIKEKMNELMGKRKDKQPLEYPSAGSTFKRPEGYYAGALIEQCGLKGRTVGGACVSEKHAGFVINKGDATSDDILSLIALIQNEVRSSTGVELEPEVIILR